MANDVLLVYTELNKCFEINMDESDHHTRIIIRKWGKPIALYIQKLTGPQTRYTVTKN